MNPKLALPLLALAAIPLAQRSSTSGSSRQPVPPTPSSAEEIQFAGGGVPRDYMILGKTTQAPRGYSYTELSLVAGNAWRTRPNMLAYHAGAAATTVEGKIFVIGGNDTVWPHNLVEAFDPATETWTRMSPMPTRRSDLAAVELNSRVYAIGGSGGGSGTAILDVVEEYDPIADSWTTKAPLPSPRQALAAAVLNGRIFAIGGASGPGGPGTTSVYEYDPDADSWQLVSLMPTPRFAHAAVAVNGRIYVVGGYIGGWGSETDTVEEFDPATNTWTTRAPLPSPRAYLAAAVVRGRIFALGGEDLVHVNIASVDEFDFATNRWIPWASLPWPRCHQAASTANDRIYAVGGFGRNTGEGR